MKVIGVSNFDLESVSDILIEENLSETDARNKVNELNEKCHENSTYYYKSVEDNYELWDSSKLY